MPIVDPGPIWKVDFSPDHARTEFSHGLGREETFGLPLDSRHPGCPMATADIDQEVQNTAAHRTGVARRAGSASL